MFFFSSGSGAGDSPPSGPEGRAPGGRPPNYFPLRFEQGLTSPAGERFILWRKIESNYHICNANTTDYHYQIPPHPGRSKPLFSPEFSPPLRRGRKQLSPPVGEPGESNLFFNLLFSFIIKLKIYIKYKISGCFSPEGSRSTPPREEK